MIGRTGFEAIRFIRDNHSKDRFFKEVIVMPCIQLNISKKIDETQELHIKEKLGKAIGLLPGKSENWLMVTIKDAVTVYFRGSKSEPAAFVSVGVYGREDGNAFNKLTGAICDILQQELNISPDHVYVQYSATQHWGWNGSNF